MEIHLLAFTPFIVLAGTAAAAGIISLTIKLLTHKAPNFTLVPAAAMPEPSKRSAEIIPFTPRRRLLAVNGNAIYQLGQASK